MIDEIYTKIGKQCMCISACVYPCYRVLVLQVFEGLHVAEVSESDPQSSKLSCCVFSQEGKSVAIGLKSGEVKVR